VYDKIAERLLSNQSLASLVAEVFTADLDRVEQMLAGPLLLSGRYQATNSAG